MILYPSSALSNPESKSVTLPKGMSGLAFQNISSWSWQLTDAHGGDYIILPFGNATIPGASGETFYVTPLSQTQALTINIPLQVGIAFLATAPAAFSQTSQLPVYTLSANVSVDTSGGPVDIQAASGVTIPVNGTVDVGTINETVSTDSNVTNVKLSTNNLVALGSATISNQTWDANQEISFQFNDVAPLVLADELWMAFSDTASFQNIQNSLCRPTQFPNPPPPQKSRGLLPRPGPPLYPLPFLD